MVLTKLVLLVLLVVLVATAAVVVTARQCCWPSCLPTSRAGSSILG
jgi:hypothetical protein